MRLLMLGGTGFLGTATVAAAREAALLATSQSA